MSFPGFDYSEAGDVTWVVYHDGGTTFVYAKTESIALMRFQAKYPDKKVRDIKRH